MKTKTMNGIVLNSILQRVPFTKKYFYGIITFETICKKRNSASWKTRDVIIINVRNAHWISLIWVDSTSAILFDSLSGIMTLNKKSMSRIFKNHFVEMENLIFQYGDDKLQNISALTCGEHVLYNILYQNIFFMENGQFDFDYVSSICKYCSSKNISPDQLVWKEIYSKIGLTDPPNLFKALTWYENQNTQ
jgi:hypothetical protein